MRKIKSALISLSDKSYLKPLLKELRKNNIKIISSGGTFKTIKKLKFKCLDVSDFTGFKEILNGRVKTLHPKIHAGILNKRNNKSHSSDIKKNNFENIDLVIVNFYPFEKTIEQTKNHSKIIENIDVGGPTIVRAAAKNYNDVTVITSTDQYSELINELKKNKLPYIVCFTDPTAGGITASFAMLGDIHFAEPGCLIAFAGKRVIQATVNEELSSDFQTAEFVEKHGFVDKIVNRHDLKLEIGNILSILLNINTKIKSETLNETPENTKEITKAAS